MTELHTFQFFKEIAKGYSSVKKIHDCMNFTVCRRGTILDKGMCTFQEKIITFFSNVTGLKCTYPEGRIGRIDYLLNPDL